MILLALLNDISFCIMLAALHTCLFGNNNGRYTVRLFYSLICMSPAITLVKKILNEPFASLMIIAIFASFVALTGNRKLKGVLLESFITFICAKGLMLLCIALSVIIYSHFASQYEDMITFVIQCAAELILLLILKITSRKIKLSILVGKHSWSILFMCLVLFTLSYGLFRNMSGPSDNEIFKYAVAVFITCVVITIVWAVNEHLRQKRIDHLMKELDRLISEAHRTKEIMPSISRQLLALKEKAAHMDNSEFTQELGVTLKELSALDMSVQQRSFQEFQLNQPFPSPSTGLRLLDCQLSAERSRAASLGIDFACVVSAPISDLHHIPQFEIQQVLGDLVGNAIHAAELSVTSPKRVLLILGVVQDAYQVQVYDTGVHFPEQVLRRIGQRGNTTDGTGNGLVDVLSVLCEHGASLTIKEFSAGLWTKCLTARLDGLCLLTTDLPGRGTQVRSIEALLKNFNWYSD